MNPQTAIMALCGLIVSIALGISSWCMLSIQQNAKSMALLEYQIKQLQTDKDIDVEQNRRLSELRDTDRKFWRLHHFAKGELNRDNATAGMPLSEWPDLEKGN
tara:strand:+ start:1275 stop:1583 length:309 start_codon:yes stop_codon:yes gene_type:complete